MGSHIKKKKYKPFFHAESGITFTTFQQVREFIWNTREHKSEISGEPLVNENHWQWSWQFLHLLGRSYTYWVLNPENVMLATADEHQNQENYGAFLKKQDEMREKYYQQNQIKKL